jgi:transcriptional regulator with XRE-family HTH domain
MARKFGELRAKLSPASQARSEARAREILHEMALADVRNAFGMSQREVAVIMNINQPAVAKIERRSDVFVSTLRDYVAAFGGNLKLMAEFPQGSTELVLAGQTASNLSGALIKSCSYTLASEFSLDSSKRSHSPGSITPEIVSEGMRSRYETTTAGNSNAVSGIWFAAGRNAKSVFSNMYVGR